MYADDMQIYVHQTTPAQSTAWDSAFSGVMEYDNISGGKDEQTHIICDHFNFFSLDTKSEWKQLCCKLYVNHLRDISSEQVLDSGLIVWTRRTQHKWGQLVLDYWWPRIKKSMGWSKQNLTWLDFNTSKMEQIGVAFSWTTELAVHSMLFKLYPRIWMHNNTSYTLFKWGLSSHEKKSCRIELMYPWQAGKHTLLWSYWLWWSSFTWAEKWSDVEVRSVSWGETVTLPGTSLGYRSF